MSEPPDDEGTLSPEDLKRLGLAGRGDLSGVTRAFTGFRAFCGALRPNRRGVYRVVWLCAALHWLGYQLGWALHPFTPPFPPGEEFEFPVPTLAEAIWEVVARQIEHPFQALDAAVFFQWQLGSAATAPLLALGLAWLLLRNARGSTRRIWVGAVVAASACTGMAMALFGPGDTWLRAERAMILIPNGVILFAGVTVATWMLYRATGFARHRYRLTECAPALFVTALLVFNLGAFCADPIGQFRWWFHGAENVVPSPGLQKTFEMIWAISEYSVRIPATLLLLLPAIIVTQGIAFRPALRLLARIAIRRTGALVAGAVGLALLALLPIGGLLFAVPRSLGWVTLTGTNLIPGSVLQALCTGLDWGLFIYATALVANALVVSLEDSPSRS